MTTTRFEGARPADGHVAATRKRPYFEDLRHVLVGSFAERIYGRFDVSNATPDAESVESKVIS
jgi:hypothetical protein